MEFTDINRTQKILRGVVGIKSILCILVILRVCGVMGPMCSIQLLIVLQLQQTLPI